MMRFFLLAIDKLIIISVLVFCRKEQIIGPFNGAQPLQRGKGM